MGGAFATIALGFIGLIAVATGKFSAFWSVIVGIVSAIVIVFSLIALGVASTVAIPIAAVLLLVTLVYRFRPSILDNNVTVNMSGGSVSDGYRIGRAAGVGIQDETRRQSGAVTRGR